MRRSVVHFETSGTSLNINADGFPWEWRAKDPLADVSREKEAVGPVAGNRTK